MKREQKEIFIQNIKTILSENSLVLLFHYRGMSMTEMTDLRVQSFNSGCNIKVTKNRLTKLALEGTDKSELSDFFDGPTAIAYSNEPVELTKLLSNFAKNNNAAKSLRKTFSTLGLSIFTATNSFVSLTVAL